MLVHPFRANFFARVFRTLRSADRLLPAMQRTGPAIHRPRVVLNVETEIYVNYVFVCRFRSVLIAPSRAVLNLRRKSIAILHYIVFTRTVGRTRLRNNLVYVSTVSVRSRVAATQ